MSVRKRIWKTGTGEEKQAWVVDYVDGAGKRRLKTFPRKKDADGYHSQANVEVSQGVHTPDTASITVAEAAKLWLDCCTDLERATTVAYEQHVRLHIVPLLGRTKLSQLSAPMIRTFEDRLRQDRSGAMVKKIRSSLGAIVGDAQERCAPARRINADRNTAIAVAKAA